MPPKPPKKPPKKPVKIKNDSGDFILTVEEVKGILSHLPTFSERGGVQSARVKLLAFIKEDEDVEE